jgi:squalene-hopene/tetraprenyl-beta-curcumene cyclase
MLSRLGAILVIAAVPGLCVDWSPKLAAEFLDSRQQEWFAWPPAAATGGPCVSCHTGVTYLLARPALRAALGEAGRTSYETGLLNALRARVESRDPKELFKAFAREPAASQAIGTESILSALFLAIEDAPAGTLSPLTRKAFDRMWSLQAREGDANGAWSWFDFDVDPWETRDSRFYGAALAALATGYTPAGYRGDADVRERVEALAAYLRREQPSQPLHNRLMVLWASAKLPELLPDATRRAWIDEVWQGQQPDGGWTLDSIGPWKKRATAAAAPGSNSYATGLTAFVLQTAGLPRTYPRLVRALEWLKSRQDRESGYWPAESMNKKYEHGSMPVRFMRDAATSFASLALLQGGGRARK